MEKIYTVKEVSEMLKVHPEAVRKWLRDGRMVGSYIGRIWRIKESDVENFLDFYRQDKEGESGLDPESFGEIRDRMAEKQDND